MGYWNHRAIEKIDLFGEKYFEIHEVYYNADGTIHAMTTRAICPYGYENMEDLKETLQRMLRACDKEPLVDKEVMFTYYENNDGDEDL